jgi:hypothetical protein
MGPGLTLFTRMFFGPHSIAAVRVRPITACLLAEYAERFATPRRPAWEETFTIEPPPRLRIAGITARRPRKTPRTLISHRPVELIQRVVRDFGDRAFVPSIVEEGVDTSVAALALRHISRHGLRVGHGGAHGRSFRPPL